MNERFYGHKRNMVPRTQIMLSFFMWVFLAAIVYGVARGIADGGRMTGAPLAALWVGALMIYGVFFAYFSPWGALSEEKAGVNAEQKTCESTSVAYSMAKKFVERSLRSPATADFPGIFSDDVTASYVGSCTHKVAAYVDSENGFGAMIRTHFVAKVKNQYGTNTWSLEDFTTR